MPAPVPADRHSVPVLEAAIVATEQVLSERLAHLAWCGSVGRSTTVARGLLGVAEERLAQLDRSREVLLRDEEEPGHRP